MAYISKNLNRPSKNSAGTREKFNTYVSFVPLDVIKKDPETDDNGVKTVEDLVLNAGEYAEKIYASPSSIKITKTSDGDEDAIGWTTGVEFSHPGDELEKNEFEQNRTNVPGIIIVGFNQCGPNPFAKIIGDCSAPVYLKVEGQNDNEGTKSLFKFEQTVKSTSVPRFHYGNIPFETPVDTVAADATTIDASAGNGEYQLQDGSASAATIDAFTNVTESTVITLKGSGGTNPSVVNAATNILLKEGASWTANLNATLTLKAFKSGAASYTMIEVSRS
ncbi:hypothetical protein AXE80_10820 [Wenyingzhuangia fucanilytica]|uniref:Uncharacterized protein n=1 Tax=Wenyingzhuangia fucanilytica TaxID=1790137 RepID=A0A1B1Y7J7_9FLAO|nr:hypothetical protein [Wenyingzhuangia fucanilytica]ANW96736.1 hypothetical protein AXE80_10820 [Wenyingzhuangia fucanilytica]